MDYNPRLKAAMLEIVDNQIRDNDPPITRLTMNRLRLQGYSEQQAREMIAAVVCGDIFSILKEGNTFDEQAYEKKLKNLGR